MSTIEQAAKRLEELRRSVALDSGDLDTEAPPGAEDSIPTPEAVMRELERREPALERVMHAPSVAIPVSQGPLMAPVGRPLRAVPEPVVSRANKTRTVAIDLPRLAARGFITPDAPTSQIADEFRVIKRPIIRNALGRDGVKLRNGNLVLITSALPGEGKTFTAVNLAISIAMEFDSTVLLIDGDVPHPSLPKILGVPETPGLLDLLTDDKIEVADALVRTNIEKLSVIPAGSPHRRATELLASAQMVTLLNELATRYSDRIVIFDSPPLLATTEARVLASHMGQIVMVVAAESTSQNTVNQALSTVERCEVVLMMLNKASQTDVGTYGYYGAEG